MATNDREERRRMRQRGAGTSGLSVGNFGFTFGASAQQPQPSPRRSPRNLPPQPSSRRTPAGPAAPAQRSSRKTPASTSSHPALNVPSGQRSSRKSPGPFPPRPSAFKTPRGTPTSATHGSTSARQSRGKQQLDAPGQVNGATFVTPSVTGKRKRRSAALGVVPESQGDELEQNDDEHRTSARKDGPNRSVRRASGRGQATPKVVTEDAEDELEENDEDHTLSTERRPASSLKGVGSARVASSPGLFVSQDELSPLQTFRRPGRPRKSIEDPRSTVAEPPESTAATRPRRSLQTAKDHKQLVEEEAEEEEEDELSPDELTPAAPRRQSGHAPESDSDSDASQFEEEVEGEEEEDASEDEDESRASTPEASSSNLRPNLNFAIRQPPPKPTAPAPRARKTQPAAAAPARKRTRRTSTSADKGPRIPVTVYRISAPRKPSDDASQIDELELPTPSAVTSARLPAVNPVDILAQITSELTTRMSTSLLQQAADVGTSDKARRAELTRRARTVEAFATELADRLFELTEAVDAGEALRARVKAALREKVELRAEFLGIRREREEVALQMDAVRKAHMEAEARRRRDEELSDALLGIETAVQRGREKAMREGRQDEGPEVGVLWELEEMLGNGVSAAGPGGGLVDRVKAFNGFLGRAAGVVEGRSG